MCDVAAVPLCTEPREAAQRLSDRSTVNRRRHAAVFDVLPLTQHQRVPVALRLGALRRCSRLRAKETSRSKRKGKYNLQMCTAYLFFGCLRSAARKENGIKRQCWKFLSTELVRHDPVPQESDVSIYGLHIQQCISYYFMKDTFTPNVLRSACFYFGVLVLRKINERNN